MGQRLGIPGGPIVPDERQVDVFLLVQDPVDVVLPVLRFNLPEPQVPVGVTRLHQLVDDVLVARRHLGVSRVLREKAAGIKHLANPVVDALPPAALGAVAKVVEPLSVQVDHHVVPLDQVLDAPINLPSELLMAQRDAPELVLHPGLDDVAHGWCRATNVDGNREERDKNERGKGPLHGGMSRSMGERVNLDQRSVIKQDGAKSETPHRGTRDTQQRAGSFILHKGTGLSLQISGMRSSTGRCHCPSEPLPPGAWRGK